MEVVSRSPLPVSSLHWQPRPGAWAFTFVCKATFLLQPGKAQLSPDQEPIHEEDSYWDDNPTRSLYAASELYPMKPRTDVVLVGSAFASGGNQVRSLVTRLIIGDLDKAIEVTTDRSFSPDGMLIGGPPFTRMPLVYERAGGGPETSNPIGVRTDVRDLRGRFKLPNLFPAAMPAPSPGEIVTPVGYGPIPPTWPFRRSKLGRYAASWSPRWLAEAPLPEDLDRSFFNAAPLDQQLPELAEDTRIVLENLHPQIPRLASSLPGLRPRATFEGRAGKTALSMRCDGLWIDSDRSICTLTWSGYIPVERRDDPGRVVITLEEMAASAHEGSGPETARVQGDPPMRPPAHTVLPDDDDDESTSTNQGTVRPPAAAALPFVPSAPTPPREDPRHTQQSSGLPFVQPKAFRSVPPAPPSAPSAPLAPLAPPPVPPVSSSGKTLPLPSLAPRTVPPAPPVAPSTRPAAPAAPASTPAWPSVKLAPPPVPPIAPPPPVLPASVPPASAQPAPVPPAPVLPTSAAAKPADDNNVWAAGLSREPVPARSIGETVVATAASAQPHQDGSSGVLVASNAAAGGATSPAARGRDGGERSVSASFAGVRASPKLDPREILHLIWYQPDSVARICRVPVWRTILDEMEQQKEEDGLDDPAPTRDPVEIEDKRDIFEILARGAAQDVEQLNEELAAAVRPGGKFVPPLLMLTGELSFPFDERETLKAMVAVTTPIASADETLKNALREAREFLAMPDVLSPAPIVEGYTARIREAIQRGRRTAATDALEMQVERALLEGRHYQRRQVLGMNAVRSLLSSGAGSGARPAPVYLPDDLARKLPLFQRFRARLIVELYLQEDQYEPHPAALKALALGRVAQSPDRRS
jgi:hypothetical protein